ncbi:MAG: hypothetical protein ACO1NX_06405, partial [Chitinophagaceae bacterium]
MIKRNLLVLGLVILCAAGFYAFAPMQETAEDPLRGAWRQQENGGEDVLLFMDGYATQTMYKLGDKEFVMSRGGTYSVDGSNLNLMFEFDTKEKANIGQRFTAQYKIDGDKLQITIDGESETWKRVDDGQAPLAGVWRITNRMQEGKLTPIHQTGPRKTLKILTGTRFQWAAINPETKEFSGSGGGTYTFENGKYTEHIEFFSRDNSRVGNSLSFDGKLENGAWHHSGK